MILIITDRKIYDKQPHSPARKRMRHQPGTRRENLIFDQSSVLFKEFVWISERATDNAVDTFR